MKFNDHKKRSKVQPYNNDRANAEKLVYHFGLMKRNFPEHYNSFIRPHPKTDWLEINLNTGEYIRRGLCNTNNGNTEQNWYWRWDWKLEFLPNSVLTELDKALIKEQKATRETLSKKYSDSIESYDFTMFYAKFVTPAFFNRDLLQKIPSHYIKEPGIALAHVFKATPLSIQQFEKAALSRNIPFEQFQIDPLAADSDIPQFDTILNINYIEREA